MPETNARRVVSPHALIGETLRGRYTIRDIRGSDILFADFDAEDREQKKPVLARVLLPEYADNEEIIAALRTGVGDVLGLSHVGIARPTDAGADELLGVAFFFVEDAERDDLQERITRAAPLAPSVAVDVLINLADALAYAAERNLCHGDIRPEHVLTGPEKPLRITRWGVAEAQFIAAADDSALLLPAAPYTAPEVWATGAATMSGDLYALGVIAYEMLTGSPPFAAAGDALAIARRHATEPVPSPRAASPSLPNALDGVTRKLLAKRPADRYDSPATLLGDLHAIRDALRYGCSLAWSPLDGDARPTTPSARSLRETFDEDGTAVMPVGPPKSAPPPEPKVELPPPEVPEPTPAGTVRGRAEPIATREEAAVLPTITEETQGVTDDAVEEEILSVAMPTPKRAKHSFNWLLPLNLFLATVLAATVGYVVYLTFLALEPPNDVIVPNLVGKSLTEAKTLAVERKFLVEIVSEQFNDKYSEDTIYQMRPEPGRHIRENKKVTIWVSKGPRMVTVPDVENMSFDKARQVLEREGLTVGDKKKEWDVLTERGNIMQQVPPAGENRQRGTRVDLTISKGPEPVPQIIDPTPLPDPSPDTNTGGAEVVLDSEKKSALTVEYDVPSDANSHIIRIDVTDSRGLRTLITEEHKAGDKVPLDVTGYGNKITFRVYDNDVLQQTLLGPPWPGSGEKAP